MKKSRSILEELNSISVDRNKHHVLENQTAGTLTVLHLEDGQLVAIDTLNHGVNHICGRKLLSNKKPILLDDIKRFKGNLKSLVKELN